MPEPKYKIGDTVWFVRAGIREVPKTCPDCLGQKALTVILGDGSQVSIDCHCCEYGYEGSRGFVGVNEWVGDIIPTTIIGIETNLQDGHEHTEYSLYDYYRTDKVFATQEEAKPYAEELRLEHEQNEAERIQRKEKPHKTWAYHVYYHRNRIRSAEKEIAHHKTKLAVAKVKAKEKVEA